MREGNRDREKGGDLSRLTLQNMLKCKRCRGSNQDSCEHVIAMAQVRRDSEVTEEWVQSISKKGGLSNIR